MPVHAVQQFRCKICRDSGVMAQRVMPPENPQNNFDVDENGRGRRFYPDIPYSAARFRVVEVACTECPPEPPRKRDWVR